MISEETIKQWLLDEDMLLEMKYDESADFHFIIEFPKENIMDVVKPKDKDCQMFKNLQIHMQDGFIYGSLVESFCSEQQARMNAMKSASDNAEEMLRKLKIQYNKLRQAAITNEMIEITAGAKAQRQKHRKEA